jgi:hypothetical protein
MILAPAAAERNTRTAAEEWRESGVAGVQELQNLGAIYDSRASGLLTRPSGFALGSRLKLPYEN